MPRQRRILIIDDNVDTTQATQEMLEENGFVVDSADNGASGLRKAHEFAPDLIILDIVMPIMNGYEVCERLRADAETAKIPIIMFSRRGSVDSLGHGDRHRIEDRYEERWNGFQIGATDFVAKPITPRKLLAAVKSIFWASGDRYRRIGSARQI